MADGTYLINNTALGQEMGQDDFLPWISTFDSSVSLPLYGFNTTNNTQYSPNLTDAELTPYVLPHLWPNITALHEMHVPDLAERAAAYLVEQTSQLEPPASLTLPRHPTSLPFCQAWTMAASRDQSLGQGMEIPTREPLATDLPTNQRDRTIPADSNCNGHSRYLEGQEVDNGGVQKITDKSFSGVVEQLRKLDDDLQNDTKRRLAQIKCSFERRSR
ncbi:hypothetical protein GGR54DRAFT_642301 [Hypoxylon sp. NC1633]|nr:hypothetical protein GGR54DRAFT_642301 [Hypoxylon sp. NC1633]